jgi:hypothetical protein
MLKKDRRNTAATPHVYTESQEAGLCQWFSIRIYTERNLIITQSCAIITGHTVQETSTKYAVVARSIWSYIIHGIFLMLHLLPTSPPSLQNPHNFLPLTCTWVSVTTSHTIKRRGDKWRGWEMCIMNERSTVSRVWIVTWRTPLRKVENTRDLQQTGGTTWTVSITAWVIGCFPKGFSLWKSKLHLRNWTREVR